MDRGNILRVWLPLLGGLWAVTWAYLYGPGPHDVLRLAGAALGLIGLAGVILARYTLGRSFSVTAQARSLVTAGIYARVRNPIYVSSCFFITGFILMVRQPRLWVVLLVIIPLQIVRARNEARVLEGAFGDAYREYRRRTWF